MIRFIGFVLQPMVKTNHIFPSHEHGTELGNSWLVKFNGFVLRPMAKKQGINFQHRTWKFEVLLNFTVFHSMEVYGLCGP